MASSVWAAGDDSKIAAALGAQGQARGAAQPSVLGQPLAPPHAGRGEAASHEQKGRRGSPTAVCRARKWGAAALKRPGAPPAAAYCRSLARIVKLTRKCHGLGAAKPRFGPAKQTLTFLGLLAKIKCSICSYQCDN